ncbi:MAG: hypothetical protein IJE72_02060 [Clostridia bacterium]|nr:hypothetical protein [Clostridia bacterium]
MADFFLELVNISITAGYIILAVIFLRLIFRKIPKKFICLLWGIAGIRLVFPFSIESTLSLIPSTKTIPDNIAMAEVPAISSGINAVNSTLNPIIADTLTPNPGDSVNPVQVLSAVAANIWLVGIILILLYGIISYIKVRKSVKTAVLLENNVWQSENVVSPFILGIINPKIYIPFNMEAETRDYVIAHENAHFRRRDHWIKPLGFLVLAVHWFNPLVWVAYILLCRDIEAACDEKVIAHMDGDLRKEYATALLECAVNRRRIAACPLAFGEVSVKNRIRYVMNYKKPAFWVIILAIIACVVASVCFLTNPETKEYYDPGYRLIIDVWEDDWVTETKSLKAEIGNKVTLDNGTKFEITLVDLQRDEIEVKLSGTPLYSDSSNRATGNFVLNLYNSLSCKTNNGETVTVEYIKMQSLDDAVTAAIMEHNSGKYLQGSYACSYHEILATEVIGEASKDNAEKITAYIIAAYGEYKWHDGNVESVSGGSGPIALTFSVEDTGYKLLEYWEAEDGRYYVDSIREKFPSSVAESVIKDPHTVSELCHEKAEAYFNNISQIAENKAYNSKAYSSSDEVEVYVDDITFGEEFFGVTLHLENKSSETVITGRPFWVYRYENNEWGSCAPAEGLAWTTEGLLILPGQTRELYCDLSLFDVSKNGCYRLEKTFYVNGEEHTATVEFVIDINDEWDKIELPVGEWTVVPESLYTVYENRVSSKQSDSWLEFEKVANNGFVEYDETVEPIKGVLIKSKADFDKFVEKMTPYFELYDAPEGMSFMGRAKMFDEEFFENNSLMIMYVHENTWSITHTLSSITRHHQMGPRDGKQESNGYALSFQVYRNIPGENGCLESERFITVAMDNAAIGDIHSYYVVYGENIYAPKETYRFAGNGLINGTVTLYSDNKMMFNYSPLSSYIPHGTYTVDNGRLVMKTDDGRFTYAFKVDGDTLVFDDVNSSDLPEYNYGNGTKFKPIPDGAEFKKE